MRANIHHRGIVGLAGAAALAAASSAGAQVITVYDNFGPDFAVASGASTGHIMGSSVAGSSPRQTAQLFTPSDGGALVELWLFINQTGASGAPTNMTIRLAPADAGLTGPEVADVLEQWTVPNLTGGNLIHLTSQSSPQLQAGQQYWLWVTIGGGRGTWRYSPDTALRSFAVKRDAGNPWGPLEDLRQGVLRVDVQSGGGPPECPADWNDDGQVNSQDISAFITDWLNSVSLGLLDADFNNDGQVNSQDISAFITAWLDAVTVGC